MRALQSFRNAGCTAKQLISQAYTQPCLPTLSKSPTVVSCASRQLVSQILPRSTVSLEELKGFSTVAQAARRLTVGGCSTPARYQFARLFASETTGSEPTVRQRIASLLGRPKEVARSVKDSVATTSSSVYTRMPHQAKQWIDAVGKPGSFQRVISLQFEAFWEHHYRKVLTVVGAVAAYFVWKTMFGLASFFVNMSETVASFGFLALAASCVAFVGLYLKHYYTINPNRVYNLAIAKLNTNPGVLEVMGAPVAGSPLRAVISTGGGLKLKGLNPRFRSKRVQMIFPLKGSERRGLVSLEAKKRKGKYEFKLLAVDVPSVGGGEQRIFLEGNNLVYTRGGILDELRDPFLRALSLDKTYEAEDDEDELKEEQHKAQQQAQTSPKPLDQGGGMYFYERVYYSIRDWITRLSSPSPTQTQKT